VLGSRRRNGRNRSRMAWSTGSGSNKGQCAACVPEQSSS
jgi:hypothetical protein